VQPLEAGPGRGNNGLRGKLEIAASSTPRHDLTTHNEKPGLFVSRAFSRTRPMTLPPDNVCHRMRVLHALIGSTNSNEAESARRKLTELLAALEMRFDCSSQEHALISALAAL
jgi:hypothetical protein